VPYPAVINDQKVICRDVNCFTGIPCTALVKVYEETLNALCR
jgi:hypothetical protein